MTPQGFNQPLYIQPFDQRSSFETGTFGWRGPLTAEQTAQIAAAEKVIYDGFKAATDEGVPVPVPSSALYQRFSSRGEADCQDRLLSAMRFGFGGHLEKAAAH